jgi:hypothetical protein
MKPNAIRKLATVAALSLVACGSVTPLGPQDAAGDGGGSDRGDAGGGDRATETPPPCPGLACPAPCDSLGEAACAARSDCRVDTCAACQGKTFAGCSDPNDPPPLCPAIACPASCATVTTLSECEARADCHSVFVDPGTCGCAPLGCCARFNRCADGNTASCNGNPSCDIVTPHCEGPYVVSYTATCYEGCVQAKDCAP